MRSDGQREDSDDRVGKATAAVASANTLKWDVEEDHLLSYFLGGEVSTEITAAADIAMEKNQEYHGSSSHQIDQIVQRPASNPNMSTTPAHVSSLDFIIGHTFDNKHQETAGILRRTASAGRSSLTVHFLDNIPEEASRIDPPSLHDRASSSDSMHKVPSATSSSSSSLSNMAAALALGGPSQVMYIQRKLQANTQIPSLSAQSLSMSPLTPLSMMGSPVAQEMMMLPPPPRFPASNGVPVQSQNNTHQQVDVFQKGVSHAESLHLQSCTDQQQIHSPNTEQHLSWIKQMNAACFEAQHHPKPFANPAPVPSTDVFKPQQCHNIISSNHPQIDQNQHQIHVGVDGATIPVTAITNADGSVSYHIDPSALKAPVPSSDLRFLTKAINEVIKPDDGEKEDPVVLAEKRRRRLARNRESARLSRRRKKEHLANLSDKVNRLQRHLESEVKSQIKSMEIGFTEWRSTMLTAIENPQVSRASLGVILRRTSANCSIRRAVIVHQYNCLRQAVLSTHNHFSIWLMMNSSQFFMNGCNQRLKSVQAKGSKSTGNRLNSKQLGEDIVNKERTVDNALTSSAHDPSRIWPLLCFELTMTMDQEERIVNQANEQVKNTQNLGTKLQHIQKTTMATHELRSAMLCLSQCSSERNDSLLMDILTPHQTTMFLRWTAHNKSRCKSVMNGLSAGKISNRNGLEKIFSKIEGVKKSHGHPSD